VCIARGHIPNGLISPAGELLLEFAFGFLAKVEWAGCRVKLWSFIRESRVHGPALHGELVLLCYK